MATEKQEERVLQVLNKHLLGEFNPEDWNPKLKMNWGGHMVEQYLTAAIPSKPDRKLVLKILKKAHRPMLFDPTSLYLW